jgi:hypothetical protein
VNADNEWRWADPLGQQRLVRTDELRAALAAGVIAPNTPVWKTGWTDWKPAHEVPELTTSALSSANGVVPNIPPPPLFIVAAQHSYEDAAVPPAEPTIHTEPPPPPRYVPSAAPPPAAPIPTPLISTPPLATRPMMPASESRVPVRAAAAPVEHKPVSSRPPPASSRPPPPSVRPVASPSASRVRVATPNPPTPAPPSPEAQSPHPETKLGVGEPAPKRPAASKPPTLPARASVIPPDDASWDDLEEDKPALPAIPMARPSETLAGGAKPPKSGEDANTGVDISALSPADAERLLAVTGSSSPTVHGVPALPPPPPLRPSSVPPTLAQAGGATADQGTKLLTPMYGSGLSAAIPMSPAHLDPPAASSPTAKPPPRKSTRPPPPLRKRGQTLMLYGGAPHEPDPPAAASPADPSPINVPAPGAQAPKAVTQAPPWNDASAKLDPTIPKAPIPHLPPMRRPADSIEEITGSVLLAEDSSADVTQQKHKIEDLSDSHVLPADASGPAKQMPASVPFPAEASAGLFGLAPVAPQSGPGGIPPNEPSSGAEPAGASASRPSALPATQPSADAGDGSLEGDLPLEPPYIPGAPPSASRRLIHDLNEMWAEPQRRWILAAGGLAAVLVLVGLVRLVSGGASSSKTVVVNAVPTGAPATPSPGEPSTGQTASTAPATAAQAAVVPSPAAASVASPPVTIAVACTAGGVAHVIAPKAQTRIGVEGAAGQSRLGLGFAIAEKEAMAVALDPTSLAALATTKHATKDPVKRVVPIVAAKGLTAAADVDHKGERILGARSVADGSFVVGSADGKLVWAAHANDAPHAIWSLESDGPVEATRAVTLADGGYAIAFRQGAAIYVGTTSADKMASGTLSRIAGLGPQIGSPALAASGDTVMVVWADRAATTDPWSLRMLRWQPGQAVGAPRVFPIPPGGLGEQAMSPGVTGVAGNRFLLAWTEGPIASHQVRAETLAATGEALGTAMTISAEGINAGQGQPIVLSDGKGLVAYMASPAGAVAQVVATPVTCPLSAP